MRLIVGLGNPGTDYAGHRHNVGFMAVDAIVERHALGPFKKRFQGLCAEGRLGSEKVLVLKPMTYMNESGRCVGEAMRFYKLKPADIVVLHDELDLERGKVRVKLGGGVAGHNGLRSIAAHIGPDFHRMRIGIGHPGHKSKVNRHVLGNFAKADREWLDPMLDAIADSAPELAAGDHSNVMNAIARAVRGEAGTEAPPAHTRPRPAAPVKGKAAGKPRAGSAPSQRDLARAAAGRAAKGANRAREADNVSSRPAGERADTPAPERSEGALAGMLRRWLGTSGN